MKFFNRIFRKSRTNKDRYKTEKDKNNARTMAPLIPKSIKPDDNEYLEKEFLIHEEPFEPIKTGFEELDKILGGGFHPGVVMLGGATSIGKTAMGVHLMIEAAKQGKKVLYVSYELSKKQMWARVFGVCQKASFKEILFDPNRNETCSEIYEQQIKRLAKNIRIEENLNYEDIMVSAQFYNLVVIDYLQRMRPITGDTNNDKRIQIANLIQKLQYNVASKNDVTVLVLSSLPRSAIAKPEMGMEYKESGDIEYTAQVAMMLHYPKDFDQEHSMKTRYRFNNDDNPIMELSICKNTIGQTGEINFKYTKNTGVFNEKYY